MLRRLATAKGKGRFQWGPFLLSLVLFYQPGENHRHFRMILMGFEMNDLPGSHEVRGLTEVDCTMSSSGRVSKYKYG
jgi:hypothetical protein